MKYRFRKSTLSVLFACHYPANLKTVQKIRLLSNCLPFINFSYFITTVGYEAFVSNAKSWDLQEYIQLNLSGELLDFSKYSDFLALDNPAENTLLINDTLGSGRKFKFGLWIYLYISCVLIHLKLITIAAPVDSDKNRRWICPYFILGRISHLKEMNWHDWERAKRELSDDELSRIDKWVAENWRSRKNASQKQIDAKKKTLFLERCLINDLVKTSSFFAFSRRNPLRWLNSLI